jgi:hypothetical protein
MKVLVRAHETEYTKGKKFIASDENGAKIIDTESPEVNLWKKNSMFRWEVQSAINKGQFANTKKTGGME